MRIAIAGYGVEGRSSYRYYSQKGHELTIIDERPKIDDLPSNTMVILGHNAFDRLRDFDMVIRSPSVLPEKLSTAQKIWSATNEFFAECPAPIIGVTGTKGKGTTASLIAGILRQAGKKVHLVGNIGVPALDEISKIQADDIVIYELSSFQLWDIEKSPHIAVMLMIEPDHLDVHASFDDYLLAKKNITRFQHEDDYVIYDVANSYSTTIAMNSKARKIAYQSDAAAHVLNDAFYHGDQKICSTSVLQVPGGHNKNNACAAIDVAWLFTQDSQVIESGLGSFAGLPHRLKFVRSANGVDYYDDSIATTAGSAVAAIQAFDRPKIMILGGSKKGGDFSSLADAINSNNVKAVILIGSEADTIKQSLATANTKITNLGSDVTMSQIVDAANQQSMPGDVIILSPACASFGMFKNYSDRGDQFIAAVNGLKN